MFKKMRRIDKIMNELEINEVLKSGEYGNLGTINTDGYPYITPLNYVYYKEKIYFHCAKTGEKIENIKLDSKVSFCIVDSVKVLSETFSTNYKSVVIFGKAYEVFEEEKISVLEELILKYSPEFLEKGKEYIKKDSSKTKVFAIEIEHITGKNQF